MDCEQSLEVLSEYYAGDLGEIERVAVHVHLSCCPPCNDVYLDVEIIVVSARVLRAEDGVSFPDENAVWQRMQFS
ncbi:MAG: zf-HC2 domain-containing protein [Pyrinomonadaceae bacterium]